MGKKRQDNRVVSALQHGKDSKFLDDLKKKLDITPMTDVQKMEFEHWMSETIARGIAFDLDSYVNKLLVDKIKSTDPDIINYESDLYNTQGKLQEYERELKFHQSVREDLKAEYLQTKNPDLLEQIDAREDAIKKSQRLFNNIMELRNKIRKEMDKKDFQKKQSELKEQELGGTTMNVEAWVEE